MFVVLDTSAIQPNFLFNSPPLVALVGGAPDAGISVCLPIVVVEELKKNHHAILDELVSKQRSLSKYWLECLVDSAYGSPLAEFAVKQSNRYGTWIDEFMRESGVSILPLPEIDHKLLLYADLINQHPWKKGDGYRDALIWQSVVELARHHSDSEVTFITQNCRDFHDMDIKQRDQSVE